VFCLVVSKILIKFAAVKPKKLKIMDIKIQKNDYVQPTEVRQGIVQDICDILINRYVNENNGMSFDITKLKTPELYIVPKRNKTEAYFSRFEEESKDRVRTCEMEEAFKILQDNGYFIFERIRTDEIVYFFSKKPYFKNQYAKREHFNVFID